MSSPEGSAGLSPISVFYYATQQAQRIFLCACCFTYLWIVLFVSTFPAVNCGGAQSCTGSQQQDQPKCDIAVVTRRWDGRTARRSAAGLGIAACLRSVRCAALRRACLRPRCRDFHPGLCIAADRTLFMLFPCLCCGCLFVNHPYKGVFGLIPLFIAAAAGIPVTCSVTAPNGGPAVRVPVGRDSGICRKHGDGGGRTGSIRKDNTIRGCPAKEDTVFLRSCVNGDLVLCSKRAVGRRVCSAAFHGQLVKRIGDCRCRICS